MSETSTVSVTGTILWLGGHSELGEAATLWMTGGVVSTTVTVVVAVVTLPEPSLAVNVTVVTPSGNTAGASLVTGGALQVSVAMGSGTLTGRPAFQVLCTLMGAGTFCSTGGSTSTTLIVAWQVSRRLSLSVAVKVTGVLPSGYGLAGDCISVIGPPPVSKDPLSMEILAAVQVPGS